MSIRENIDFIHKIEELLVDKLPIRLGVNKKNELVRLIYEVSRAGGWSVWDILDQAGIAQFSEDEKGELFHRIKKKLLKIRYPFLESGCNPRIMPLKIRSNHAECPIWDFQIDPRLIFIEKNVKDLEWTQGFLSNFPEAEPVIIKDVDEGLKRVSREDPVRLYNARRKNIFLVKAKTAFLKTCPCTKEAFRCGYRILNIGFGCPVDCSYCYLQTYSNAPGIILPANIEDYFGPLRELDRDLTGRVRIGTGEFTDSLALERYTHYAAYLIPFFRDTKNMIFELKTKVSEIDDILKIDPHKNAVISWSINTVDIVKRYEKGSAAVEKRIDAALRAVQKGYKVGFHFDPIVYYEEWEKDYKTIVEKLFSYDVIRNNVLWISLGTLRYTPGLKQAAEQRFSDNHMFYRGEFFEGFDGKLRYPEKIRIDIYNKMVSWIKEQNTSAWVYLCMEPEDVWTATALKDAPRCYGQLETN